MGSKRPSKTVKALLSIFIAYHLTCVFILPNPTSTIGRVFSPYLTPYANLININTTWQFFSPNPGGSRYLNVELISYEDDEAKIQEFIYPPKKRPLLMFENYNRIVYYSLQSTANELQFEKYFGPYMCRKYPGIDKVNVEPVIDVLPPMEKADLVGETQRSEILNEIATQAYTYYCPEELNHGG